MIATQDLEPDGRGHGAQLAAAGLLGLRGKAVPVEGALTIIQKAFDLYPYYGKVPEQQPTGF